MNIQETKIKDGYILRELGGEYCIFHEDDRENGSVDGLPSINEACAFLWKRLEQGADAAELTRAVAKRFCIEEDEAEYEVSEFLAKLIHGNILEIQREGSEGK